MQHTLNKICLVFFAGIFPYWKTLGVTELQITCLVYQKLLAIFFFSYFVEFVHLLSK